MDNKFLALVTLLLKAGVSVEGVVQPTEKGVPQGGVLSPLLANMVLNRLDWFLHNKGIYDKAGKLRNWIHGGTNVRFVRYADDWCVFITRASKRYVSALRDQIRDFLAETSGLRLSEEKTRITHIKDGFDFLGFRLVLEKGRRGVMVPKINIGEKAKKRLRLKLSEAVRYRPHQESVALRVQRASHLIRGWREYFRVAHDIKKVAHTYDYLAFWETVKGACRKHDLTTAKCLKRYCRNSRFVVGEGNVLERIMDAELKFKISGPEEYVPGGAVVYPDGEDDEPPHLFCEDKRRRGGFDMRWEVMVRDSLCCRKCGKVVDYSIARIDHIISVKHFASFREAHRIENLQTLCAPCHQEKTNAERNSQR